MADKNQTITLRNLRILAGSFLLLTAIYAYGHPLAELEAQASRCMSKWLFGVSCAGCGFTKATVAFWQGAWATAFQYHAFVFVVMLGCSVVVLSALSAKASQWVYELLHRTWFWLTALAAFFLYFIIRLSFGLTV